MKLGFRNRVLLTIFLACMVCSAAAVVVSRHRIARNGEDALIEKSRAILSRLEVGRTYVAEQGGLDDAIKKLVADHPDGKIDEENKLFILRRVPIYSAMRLGQEGAEKEHYRFRIFASDPRNKDNTPTNEEKEYLKRFETSSETEIVERVDDGKSLAVMRPIHISKAQGCLNCHGHPSTSPFGNGKDILGYKMEDWSDGMIHGSFAVISSLEPVVAQTEAATREIMLWATGFTLLALGMGFLMVRGPIGAILQATSELKEAGEQVGSASGQLSGVSQGLSSSSNEAAASLEETVSSLEELSSMVSRNTENAKEAAALSNASRSAAEKGEGEISELINAMGSISDSAKKMEDIINVIDDIAFQTNLLALNAAVEAARAGEQGKGFAVVAEAVRNLAQRSAQAAKEINVLIKDSGQRVEAGAEIADSSGAVLKEIVNSVKKVADLNTEIATASQEQSSGLNQISQAMNQLDKTTQHNAASAEEAAASSEELSAQAVAVQRMVRQLFSAVSGGEEVGFKQQPGRPSNVVTMAPLKRPTPKTSSASDVIPFDDDQPARKVGNLDGF